MLITWLGKNIYMSMIHQLWCLYTLRTAWHVSRIIMRQVSWESRYIFDFIIEVYQACKGDWNLLADRVKISDAALEAFLECAAVFLANVGNYYVWIDGRDIYEPCSC